MPREAGSCLWAWPSVASSHLLSTGRRHTSACSLGLNLQGNTSVLQHIFLPGGMRNRLNTTFAPLPYPSRPCLHVSLPTEVRSPRLSPTSPNRCPGAAPRRHQSSPLSQWMNRSTRRKHKSSRIDDGCTMRSRLDTYRRLSMAPFVLLPLPSFSTPTQLCTLKYSPWQTAKQPLKQQIHAHPYEFPIAMNALFL